MLTTLITNELTLTPMEKRYLNRLIKHDWYYALASTNRVYKKGKENEEKLKQMAIDEGGNFLILFERTESLKRGNIVN